MLCDRIVHDPGRKAAYNRLNSCVEFDASTQLAPTLNLRHSRYTAYELGFESLAGTKRIFCFFPSRGL